MTVFNQYARYYDALYKDKDYQAESDYVAATIREYAPDSRAVLELGCGTGSHAFLLANAGFDCHGVDLSEEMIKAAKMKAKEQNEKIQSRLTFNVGDARTYETSRRFDAVVSLFHVFSYQNTNEDLACSFKTALKHLVPGGILIADYWFGPAVLHQKPGPRIKRLEDRHGRIIRLADPHTHITKNLVDVKYEIIFVDEASKSIESLTETHTMRYFFVPELEYFASTLGFELITSRKWMSTEDPDLDSWSACSIFRKVGK